MLTICLTEFAHLSIAVSQIERDIGRKSYSHSSRAFDAPGKGGGSQLPVGIAPPRLIRKN